MCFYYCDTIKYISKNHTEFLYGFLFWIDGITTILFLCPSIKRVLKGELVGDQEGVSPICWSLLRFFRIILIWLIVWNYGIIIIIMDKMRTDRNGIWGSYDRCCTNRIGI